jgi:hypothetical protein
MACLTLTVTPPQPSSLAIDLAPGASLDVTAGAGASLAIEAAEQARLEAVAAEQASLAVSPKDLAQLEVGEVCVVSGGTLVVLAGSDGPLRTRDGGYFLLNPAANPPE